MIDNSKLSTAGDLENRVSRIFLTTGAILATLALALGIAFRVPFLLNVPHMAVMFICIVLPLIFRNNRAVPTLTALYFVSYVYFPFIYFTNNGLTGAGPFFFIMIMVYYAFYRQGRKYFLVVIPLTFYYLVIIWFGYAHPGSVLPYSDRLSQYIDMSVGFLSVTTVMSIVANTTYNGYEGERENALALAAAQEEKNGKLEKLSITDQLTGVYNRAFFMDKLRNEMGFARKARKTFFIIMLDIDHFKIFNDTYGHLVGDEVLRKIGETLRDCVRDHDAVSRYGGEEFIVLVSHGSPDTGEMVGERIRQAVENLTYRDVGRITVSVGVSSGTGGEEAEEIIRRADEMLYRAKTEGRNRVESYRKKRVD